MYIGIYINESHITAALLNQDEEVVPINGTAIATNHKSSDIPLKIYIEDEFAYVGRTVDHLIANDYGLNCAKYFLDDLHHPEKTTYTDPSGGDWKVPALLAIFLKKMKNDISAYNEVPVQGAMVTTTKAITQSLTNSLRLAFELAEIPLCGVVDIGKAAWQGSGLDQSTIHVKKLLVYNLDKRALTVSAVTVDKDSITDTLLIESDTSLGENRLQEDIMDFLAKTYFHMTGRKIKKTAKSAIGLKKMAKNLLLDYFSQSELYVRNVYAMTEPAIELVLTRAQLDAMISKYMQRSLSFLKEVLSSADIQPDDISEIVLTGESKVLQIVPSTLQTFFHPKKTNIHHQNTTDIITKGITLLANDAVEREISSSLLTDRDLKSESAHKNGMPSKAIEENHTTNQLLQLIHCMQINRTGDM